MFFVFNPVFQIRIGPCTVFTEQNENKVLIIFHTQNGSVFQKKKMLDILAVNLNKFPFLLIKAITVNYNKKLLTNITLNLQ